MRRTWRKSWALREVGWSLWGAVFATLFLLGSNTGGVEGDPSSAQIQWRRAARGIAERWRLAWAAAPAVRVPGRPLSARVLLRDDGATQRLHTYPPLGGGRAPLVMMLHGACGQPLPTCDYWSKAGREGSWLLCPGGNTRYRGRNWECRNELDWAGDGEDKASFIDESRALFEDAFGDLYDRQAGDVLIGFSRGAFVARDVVLARPGLWRGLILIGAWLEPVAADLKAAGIQRVVMMAGQHDDARPAMERAVTSLQADGLPARFINTGPIWHQLPVDLERLLRDALAWVRRPVGATS